MKYIFLLFFSNLLLNANGLKIIIKISEQKLYLIQGEKILNEYPVSTSKYGVGSKELSKKTPLGKHFIFEKFGKNSAIGMVFDCRMKTKKITKIYKKDPNIKLGDIITYPYIMVKGKREEKKLRWKSRQLFKTYLYSRNTRRMANRNSFF